MGEIRNTLVFRKEENEAEKYQKKFSHACNYYIPNTIRLIVYYYVEREKVFAWCPLLRKVVGALY